MAYATCKKLFCRRLHTQKLRKFLKVEVGLLVDMLPDCALRIYHSRMGPWLAPRTIPLCFWYQTRGYKHHKHKRAEPRMSLYTVLGVSPKATQTQIKMAYYKLSKVYHPDLNQGSKTAQDRFAAISEAYSVLGNAKLRRRYDRGIFTEWDHHSETKEKASKHEKEQARKFSVYYNTHGQRMYDFDEFYKAHYGQALRREQRMREQQKRRTDAWQQQQKEAKMPLWATFSIVSTALLFASWILRRV